VTIADLPSSNFILFSILSENDSEKKYNAGFTAADAAERGDCAERKRKKRRAF
jgi:hypothetical protein